MTDFSGLMNSLLSLLQNWTTAFLSFLYNIVVDFVQVLFDYVVTFALFVVSLFPAGSPVPSFTESAPTGTVMNAVICGINWFFPVGYCLSLLVAFFAACVGYFSIAPLARKLGLLT